MPRHDLPENGDKHTMRITVQIDPFTFTDSIAPLCPGRKAPQLVTRMPPHLKNHQPQIMGELLNAGGVPSIEFNQVVMLRPQCATCNTCLPARVDLDAYAPSNRLRRMTDDLASKVTIGIQDMTIARDNAAHGYLWMTYVMARGPGHFYGEFTEALALDSYPTKENYPAVPSLILSFRSNASGALVGGMELVPALHVIGSKHGQTEYPVVYGARNYFKTDGTHPAPSAGIAQISMACDWLKAQGYKYFYLGATTTTQGPFAYKQRFRPELRHPDGIWRPMV